LDVGAIEIRFETWMLWKGYPASLTAQPPVAGDVRESVEATITHALEDTTL
jgi:hypothetical protein